MPRRSKLLSKERSASANQLMPLHELKQISAAMSHIMNVGLQVEQLKQNLQQTQDQLIRALKRQGVDLSDSNLDSRSQLLPSYL